MKVTKFFLPAALLLAFGMYANPGASFAQDAAAAKTIETLASFPAGYGMEGLTETPDGTIVFEVANDDVQSLWKYTNGKAEKWVDIPVKRPQIVLSIKEGFLVSGAMQRIGGAAPAAGAAPPPVPAGVDPNTAAAPPATTDYQSMVVVLDKSGALVKTIKANPGCFMNGMTETHGEYLAVDARGGTIYRVDIAKGELVPWFHSDMLSPTMARNYPGANGMRAFGDWVYWTNTVRGVMYRVHVGKDGMAEGEAVKFATVPGGDDFGVAKDGTFYLHSGGNMMKVSPAGDTSTFVPMISSSPAAIVSKDQHWLYWTVRGTNSTDAAPVPRLLRVKLE